MDPKTQISVARKEGSEHFNELNGIDISGKDFLRIHRVVTLMGRHRRIPNCHSIIEWKIVRQLHACGKHLELDLHFISTNDVRWT